MRKPKLYHAVYCDGLVLGCGVTAVDAEQDAERAGAEIAGTDPARITKEAARYVWNGGDCRALKMTETSDGDVLFDMRREE